MICFTDFLIAFGLTLFAGLATGIGGAFAFFAKHTNKKILSIGLGFSAGIMIYVAFIEMFQTAQINITAALGDKLGGWITILSFFTGIGVIAIIDSLIPSFENPHEVHKLEEMNDKKKAAKFKKLYRVGIFTAIALAIHNFPEGIATFVSAVVDIKLGIAIAIAIAIHNIPEGIAISIPIYYSTGNRKKAFWYSFLSGLTEPLGALLAYVILYNYCSDLVLGIVFAIVAGIMIFISLEELLPAARENGDGHLAIWGLIAGMAVMAISLLILI